MCLSQGSNVSPRESKYTLRPTFGKQAATPLPPQISWPVLIFREISELAHRSDPTHKSWGYFGSSVMWVRLFPVSHPVITFNDAIYLRFMIVPYISIKLWRKYLICSFSCLKTLIYWAWQTQNSWKRLNSEEWGDLSSTVWPWRAHVITPVTWEERPIYFPQSLWGIYTCND